MLRHCRRMWITGGLEKMWCLLNSSRFWQSWEVLVMPTVRSVSRWSWGTRSYRSSLKKSGTSVCNHHDTVPTSINNASPNINIKLCSSRWSRRLYLHHFSCPLLCSTKLLLITMMLVMVVKSINVLLMKIWFEGRKPCNNNHVLWWPH